MKNLALLFALLAIPAFGEYDAVTIRTSTALTPTNSVILTNAIPVTGKIVAFTASASGGAATSRVYTVAGNGSSHAAARTLQGVTATPVTGYTTNYIVFDYLAGDLLVARFDNAAITSSVSAVVTIIFER